ncbi:MAG: hypothetical protein Q4G12_10555, partial [Bacteroidales bacterium]|nr:hypothetical protein [Bacteroidales bacterium]
RNSSLSLIKRQAKFILLKLRNTTSPNDRFGLIHFRKQLDLSIFVVQRIIKGTVLLMAFSLIACAIAEYCLL